MSDNKNMENAFTDFDYEKERQEFIAELGGDKFGGQIKNDGIDFQEKENDLDAFDEYMNSESFKNLDMAVSK